MEIKNLVTLISGGASGLGKATAKKLAEAGAVVAIIDNDYELLEKTSLELNCFSIKTDVRSSKEIQHAINEIQKKYGIIRILINCAGISSPSKVISKSQVITIENFTNVIHTNLIGTFDLIRIIAKNLSETKSLNNDNERGVIINTASIAAYEGQIGQAAYAASKGGIASMTLPLAREFSDIGVRVLSIAPGLFNTPMVESIPKDIKKFLSDKVPFPKRLGLPEEFASLVLHIITNSMLNGEVIRLDGALRMV